MTNTNRKTCWNSHNLGNLRIAILCTQRDSTSSLKNKIYSSHSIIYKCSSDRTNWNFLLEFMWHLMLLNFSGCFLVNNGHTIDPFCITLGLTNNVTGCITSYTLAASLLHADWQRILSWHPWRSWVQDMKLSFHWWQGPMIPIPWKCSESW